MRSMQNWFDEYAESHQNIFNKIVHTICVPSIFFCVIGLFASIPVSLSSVFPEALAAYAHLGTVVVIAGLVFYLRVSPAMFVGMAAVSVASLWGVAYINTHFSTPLWQICLTVFVVAWIGQFIGHKVEGKKPSFFKDLQFLMIGPAWLLGFVYKKVGLKY
ncbi:Uncharacterized membrane protein YGL010W [Flexibacter flexilis DSM 6793]|uniref:Uncharacterized membrane protein YGL010W n=1 Tax=Flexibacter flexilis DSM 6793 TaxID=927664 RepID=A0A1I1DNY4_9BACT|nr:Mpo1-like protein [Flexibacter flexilis]SFB74758.1 Uncharacterized membrane protein YGL010W [Flexibacter flexilis DSM 6793]